MEIGSLKLPPGFRFSPTDEELILHFLLPKSCNNNLSSSQYPPIIPDLIGFQPNPWDLTGKALSSGSHFFYFSQVMNNRNTSNGYWKDLDMEEPIFAGCGRVQLGTKKILMFCSYGEDQEIAGQETSWIMEEYHLSSNKLGNHQMLEYGCSLVLCRVRARKNCSSISSGELAFRGGAGGDDVVVADDDDDTEISSLDEMFLSLDDRPDDASFSD